LTVPEPPLPPEFELELLDAPPEPAAPVLELLLDPHAASSSDAVIASAIAGVRRCLTVTPWLS
jgi:hypothetical protein